MFCFFLSPVFVLKPVVHVLPCLFFVHIINNGNRTEWSPIQSVIIQVINKYDYRQNWTTRSPDTN